MKKTVGIVGAGRIGSSLGALASDAGWRVQFFDVLPDAVANAPVTLGDNATQASSFAGLVTANDLIILAVPFSESARLDYSLLSDKIVVDAMNYWPAIDGVAPDSQSAATTRQLAARNPRMRLIKTFNHFAWHELISDARSASVSQRRAMVVAGDDQQARTQVAGLVSDIGFDPVLAPAVLEPMLQPGGELFGVRMTAAELGAKVDELLGGKPLG